MTYFFHFSSGVFKVDHAVAGFKDLQDVAKKRSQDENFYSLIIRKVSQSNYGIEFVYLSYDSGRKIDIYRKELEKQFGRGDGGVYAVDYSNHRGGSDSLNDEHFCNQRQSIKNSVIQSKALPIDF